MAGKFNPFRPNNMVTIGMFVGRVDEIEAIEKCYFQTKHGNPQHFLVQGERGIGKSSLLFFVEAIARGVVPYSETEKFNFLVVSIDLAASDTQIDIIRSIGRGLRHALNDHDSAKAIAGEFWEWITNWEILGIKYHKPSEDLDPEVVTDDLVSRLSEFCQTTDKDLDGVVILIDEADRPDVEAGLGALLKRLSERLTKKQCNKVLLGLAGLPIIIQKLRDKSFRN